MGELQVKTPWVIQIEALQAALTAALGALIVMRDYYAPDGVPGIVDAAIAQIEALKGPTP